MAERWTALSPFPARANHGLPRQQSDGPVPLCDRYTLADNFFHAAFGGSLLNHFWLICACTPRFDNAPPAIRAVLDEKGNLVKDGAGHAGRPGRVSRSSQ